MRAVILLMVAVALSGCAAMKDKFASMSAQAGGSYVSEGITEVDSGVVAKDITDFLVEQLPAAKTTLGVSSSRSPFDALLREVLARSGFGVADDRSDSAIPFRYLVTHLDKGVLVRLRYGNKEASRYYDRSADGQLALNSIFTVREAVK